MKMACSKFGDIFFLLYIFINMTSIMVCLMTNDNKLTFDLLKNVPYMCLTLLTWV